MACDIAKHLLRTLAAADVVLSEGALKSLLASYQRRAEDAINDYYALSRFNGLIFKRHEEESAVSTFARALKAGAEQFQLDPSGALIPNWARVLAAVPDAGDVLLEAVESEGGILSAGAGAHLQTCRIPFSSCSALSRRSRYARARSRAPSPKASAPARTIPPDMIEKAATRIAPPTPTFSSARERRTRGRRRGRGAHRPAPTGRPC